MLNEWEIYAKSSQYQRRINKARESIAKTLASGRRFYASVSFGKDSSVMLRLLLDVVPSITVLYMRSGYALPDTLRYIDKLQKLWSINLTIIDTPIDYIELCREYGLPHLRASSTQKKIVSLLKKNPANTWAVENGYTGLFWGLRADESNGRKMLLKCHPYGIVDKNNILRVAPVAWMQARDIWAYIYTTHMPYNTLYDKENCGYTREVLRNTGWLSTDGESRGQIEWLRRNYPQQYQVIREML